MGRHISGHREKVRMAFRITEARGFHSLALEDLLKLARNIPPQTAVNDARLELKTGLLKMTEILPDIDQTVELDTIWANAVKECPNAMWWNVSKEFREAVFVPLTPHRLGLLYKQAMKKQSAERIHKQLLLGRLLDACPKLKPMIQECIMAMKPAKTALTDGR